MSLYDLSSPKSRIVGLKQVLRYAREDMLGKVFIARDADETITERLKQTCEKYRIPYDATHTMHQIGSACQIDVGSACAGVKKREE